ncbi:hypothetical protein H6G00_01090 [Leptolyngbya sp. FACHB-541]|nr:hypothetical protein [Leptolyngbya sp. FACHB-541]
MSEDSQRNSAFNAAVSSKVHHAQLNDTGKYTPEKLGHLYRGGIRTGAGRTEAQAQQMLDKIPPSQRAGVDGQSAAAKVKEYLADKDASHIKPHSKGGSSHPDNIKWEGKTANRARGDQHMTSQEQRQLNVKAQADNIRGALKAGVEAASKGAVIGAVTTAPFSMLRNALRVVRGEMSAQDAALETVKETAVGGGVGATTAFTVTAVASACPPIAVALTAMSPVLLAAGGVGMVCEFFKILGDHKQQVKEYYSSLTQRELQYLQDVESELLYEHSKNSEFLNKSAELNAEITHRPIESGVEGALKRYLESAAIAKALGATPIGNKQLPVSKKTLPSA